MPAHDLNYALNGRTHANKASSRLSTRKPTAISMPQIGANEQVRLSREAFSDHLQHPGIISFSNTKPRRHGSFRIAAFGISSRPGPERVDYWLLFRLAEPLIRRLKVVPLSSFRFPLPRLSVEPPSAEALPEDEIWIPLSAPTVLPVVFWTLRVVLPAVFPTALVVLPTTLPTVDAVVLVTPPTVLPTPPSKPPPPPRDEDVLVVERALEDELAIVSEPNRSSFEALIRFDACVTEMMLPVIGMFDDPLCK